MGQQEVERELDAERLRVFTKKLLGDLRALEQMLADGVIESGVRRIGAEQEMFLVDRNWRPASIALDLLEDLADPHFTTELGRFNLEMNLDPVAWGGRCLHTLATQLDELLEKVSDVAAKHEARLILTGILPTLEKGDLSLDNMTPRPRYYALNEAMRRLRGEDYRFWIKGRDELILTHDSVMLEACNTSFQIHFQVGPGEFARLYNIAQTVAAPVLAAAANSPLLFGRQLWRETRIALFQQSIDTRAPSHHREQNARVSFGQRWVDDSVLEIFRDDTARFRVLLGADIEEDPFDQLRAGKVPSLQALRLHNGTVYRWMRPCYGVSGEQAHLRIENRILPAGPTPRDEMANAAFWFGLMSGLSGEIPDVRVAFEFSQVKENFIAAARLGLGAQLAWRNRANIPAQQLILEELLPLARHGLEAGGIASEDIDLHLGTIEERVRSGRSGAQWMVDSFAELKRNSSRAQASAALVAASSAGLASKRPVSEWSLAKSEDSGRQTRHHRKIGQIMTTDLFTVGEDELVDLVAALMDWRHIRHVPVEDSQHRLVGLVTHRTLIRLLAKDQARSGLPLPVREIMQRELVTVSSDTSTLEAIQLMREHRVGCLPVVDQGRLVGIVTERDLINLSADLLEDALREDAER